MGVGYAYPKAAQPAVTVAKRLCKYARHQILFVIRIAVRGAVVRNPVQYADLVVERAGQHAASQLDAGIAIGRQVSRQAALDELGIYILLQSLQAERGLEFSGADIERLIEHEFDVRVLQYRGAIAEIGH